MWCSEGIFFFFLLSWVFHWSWFSTQCNHSLLQTIALVSFCWSDLISANRFGSEFTVELDYWDNMQKDFIIWIKPLYIFFIQWKKQSCIEIPLELHKLKYNIICCWDHRKLQRVSSVIPGTAVVSPCVGSFLVVCGPSKLSSMNLCSLTTKSCLHMEKCTLVQNHRPSVQAKCGQQHQGKQREGWVGASQVNLCTYVDCETASLFSETLTSTAFISTNWLCLKTNKKKSHRSYNTQTS